MKPQVKKVKVTFEYILPGFRAGYIASGSLFVLRGREEIAIRRWIESKHDTGFVGIDYLAIDFPGAWEGE